MLLKDLKRGMSHGERKREKWEQDRIKNEVTDRARVQVRFCFHFSFSRFPLPVPRHTLQSHVVVLQ